MIRVGLTLLAAALLLGACGNTVCSTGCAEYTPKFPSEGFEVVVTEHDRAATAHVGQKIELVLRAKAGMSDWSGVSVDDPTILQGVPTGIAAVKGVTIAGYQAIAPGTARITATAVPLCSPGQACPAIAMLFEVTVTVS